MKKEHCVAFRRLDSLRQTLGEDPIMRSFTPNARAKGDKPSSDRGIVFTLSTPGIKRDGHEVVQKGWELKDYRANPVVLWAHDRTGVPIARSLREELVNDKALGGKVLRGEAEFEDDPFSDRIFGMYNRGTLSAVSVGWRTLEFEYLRDEEDYISGVRFLRQQLLEYSAVPVPADESALKRALSGMDADGLELFSNQSEVNPDNCLYLDLPEALEARTWFDFGSVTRTLDQVINDVKADLEEEKLDLTADNVREAQIASAEAEEPVETKPIVISVRTVGFEEHGKIAILDEAAEWNPRAAWGRLEQFAENSEGEFDPKVFRKAFLYTSLDNGRRTWFGLHHDIVDGVMVSCPRAIHNATQRYLRGEFGKLDAVEDAAVRKHITEEFSFLGLRSPLDHPLCANYKLFMDQSNSWTQEQGDDFRDLIRTQSKQASEILFGDYRLNEDWEDSETIWGRLSSIFSTLDTMAGSREKAEFRAESMVNYCKPLFKAHMDALALVGRLFKVTATETAEELLDYIAEIKKDRFIEDDDLDLDKFLDAIDNVVNTKKDTNTLDKDNKSRVNKDKEDIRSLFDSILSEFPAAGDDRDSDGKGDSDS